MITPMQAILTILKDNIHIDDGDVVPVIKRNYPLDKTPCITIENTGGSTTRNKWRLNLPYKLDADHPQYDKDNPNAKYPQDVLKTEKSTIINIHIWSDNEIERESINNQISDCFLKVESDYCKYCSRYNDGICSTTSKKCEALNDEFSRGIKMQCPNPRDLDYENIYTRYNLVREKCNLESPFDVDDLDTEPITLHSVFKFTCNFYEYHVIGGNISNKISFKQQ